MKITDFNANDRSWLKMTDLENVFRVYLDKRGNYVYNLNSSLYINADPSMLSTYVLNHDMHWTLISYKLYGTTHLAWLLMKLNDVSTADVFSIKRASDVIYYIPKMQLEPLISNLAEET